MDYGSDRIRTPFRPIQQQMYSSNTRDRLKDSPMDFSYDPPQRETSHASSSNSSSWLNSDEDKKRPREAIDRSEVFAFGDKSPSMTGSSGTFLFHQPLSPTIAGPDVEMTSETTPTKPAGEAAKASFETDTEASASRPIASGALTRVTRSRGGNAKKGAAISSEQPRVRRSNSQSKNRRKGRAVDDNEEWEDEQKEKAKSLGRRMGDITNVQYVFGGHSDTQSEKRQAPSWLDPEWCLGMAQFAFNSTLLLGVLWLLFGVVRTLQRDVADKVREYELEFLSEIEGCSHSYHLNKCGTEGAVPALATACASWQKCSAKDPAIVGRARVTAETVAEIVNGFVDVVSWKSMLFTLLSLIIIVGATNSTLSFFRLRTRRSQATNAQHFTHDHPGAVPYDLRSINGGYSNAAMYHPYPANWHASPPSTPSTKRMCR